MQIVPLYVTLDERGYATKGGAGPWPLPKNEQPAAWIEVPSGPDTEQLKILRADDLLDAIGTQCWTVQIDGDLADWGDCFVTRRARLTRRVEGWDERSLRLFACDCAARVLPLYETQFRINRSPRRAISTARAVSEPLYTAKSILLRLVSDRRALDARSRTLQRNQYRAAKAAARAKPAAAWFIETYGDGQYIAARAALAAASACALDFSVAAKNASHHAAIAAATDAVSQSPDVAGSVASEAQLRRKSILISKAARRAKMDVDRLAQREGRRFPNAGKNYESMNLAVERRAAALLDQQSTELDAGLREASEDKWAMIKAEWDRYFDGERRWQRDRLLALTGIRSNSEHPYRS